MFGFKKIKQAAKQPRPGQTQAEQEAAAAAKQSPAEKVVKEKRLLEAEKAFREGIVSVRDIIAPASFKISNNFLQLNDLYVRTLFVMTYPRYVTIGWLK